MKRYWTKFFKPIIAVIASAAMGLSAGCQTSNHPPVLPPQDGGQVPDPKDHSAFTWQDIQRNLQTTGKRVMVVFSDFEVAGATHTCPVKIRTLDNVCATNDFQSNDASVVCRVANGATDTPSLSRITWRSDVDATPGANVNFTVEFEGGYMPCQDGWSGAKPQRSQTCDLKSERGLEIGGARRVYVKYTIVAQDPVCPPLDPYFIVRH